MGGGLPTAPQIHQVHLLTLEKGMLASFQVIHQGGFSDRTCLADVSPVLLV